jgi:queuine tRNA-ribosyltransferase
MSIATQNRLGSDIALCLDYMPISLRGFVDYELATMHSLHWAERCLKQHQNSNQVLAGIAQGGPYESLRLENTKALRTMKFELVAIGGVKQLHETRLRQRCVSASICGLDESQLRYAMGIGHPLEILELVELGIDCFDAGFATICAAKGLRITSLGLIPVKFDALRIRDLRRIYTNANGEEEIAYGRSVEHLAKLNLSFMESLMHQIQQSIKENCFAKFKHRFESEWQNSLTQTQHNIALVE